MSEKLDGIRAYWNGKHLISRGGKIIHAPKWFTKNYPPFEIDGELWIKQGTFVRLSSIVRDKIPSDEWKEVKHCIFEVPHAKGGLFERLSKVKPYENEVIKIIPQIEAENKEHLEKFLKEIEAKGGEGVVVRDPNALYINKRSDKALKVKTFHDTECEVVGYAGGRGKFEGLVGALECKLSTGVVFRLGTGMSDAQRKNPPLLGASVTFKYQELTKLGKPRFPVFVRE